MGSLEEWEKEHVHAWISGLGEDFRSTADQLLRRGVDGDDLVEEDTEDLLEGIEFEIKFNKKKLFKAIRKLKKLSSDGLQALFDRLEAQSKVANQKAGKDVGAYDAYSKDVGADDDYTDEYAMGEYTEVGVVEDEIPDEDDSKFVIYDELNAKSFKSRNEAGYRYGHFADFKSWKKIAEGNFGYVFIARWTIPEVSKYHEKVVVKVSKSLADSSTADAKEVGIFHNLPGSNVNVLSIIGTFHDFSHPMYKGASPIGIVTPFMKYGALTDYAKNFAAELGEGNNYCQIALGMARGINALHRKQIIHRDIATRNFLVDELGRVVVADFGMSRLVDDDGQFAEDDDDHNDYYVNLAAAFPWRWSAPETLRSLRWSLRTDVWMYGVTLWELCTCKKPFPKMRTPIDLKESLNEGLTLEAPPNMIDVLREAMQMCLKMDSDQRPTMQAVVNFLDGYEARKQEKLNREIVKKRNEAEEEASRQRRDEAVRQHQDRKAKMAADVARQEAALQAKIMRKAEKETQRMTSTGTGDEGKADETDYGAAGEEEIITIQLGQGGNQIGMKFFEQIANEDSDRKNAYFEKSGRHYKPRAIVVDMEPGMKDVLKQSPVFKNYNTGDMIFGASGCGNNFAKGMYTEGAEVVDEVVDIIRKKAESCSNLQGFQLIHALGGGTGSGLGSLVAIKIKDNYPEAILSSFPVIASQKVSDIVVEPYNNTLALFQLQECGYVVCIDNEAAYMITHNVQKIAQPRYENLNTVIASAMSAVTSSLRFSGSSYRYMKDIAQNLSLGDRNLLVPNFAPFKGTSYTNVSDVIADVTNNKNSLVFMGNTSGKLLRGFFQYRGPRNVDDHLIPSPATVACYEVPHTTAAESCGLLRNDTGVEHMLDRVLTQFKKMYKRKAFLHWYKGEGMDEMEFAEAAEGLTNRIEAYRASDP